MARMKFFPENVKLRILRKIKQAVAVLQQNAIPDLFSFIISPYRVFSLKHTIIENFGWIHDFVVILNSFYRIYILDFHNSGFMNNKSKTLKIMLCVWEIPFCCWSILLCLRSLCSCVGKAGGSFHEVWRKAETQETEAQEAEDYVRGTQGTRIKICTKPDATSSRRTWLHRWRHVWS